MRNREIGQQLNIGEGTVKVYLHAIYQKLNIENRTELALMVVNDELG
jgi:two-component system nitrate/nitrite response regulator NarP